MTLKLVTHRDYFAVFSAVTKAVGMDIPVAIVESAADAAGGATVRVSIQIITNIAKNLYQRYASLQTNERQRDEICNKVTELQGILQKAMETAVDTRDDLTRQALWNLQQKLTKCLEICKEVEKRSFRAKFQNAPDDVQRVQELSHLVYIHCNTLLLSSQLHYPSCYTTEPETCRWTCSKSTRRCIRIG